jgi:ABC-type nitrate/sulfonate/bicarbonate transport system substrate-binding protein
MTAADDEAKPMTRTELAMLWDLLGTWLESHPAETVQRYDRNAANSDAAARLRDHIDAELAQRFGG